MINVDMHHHYDPSLNTTDHALYMYVISRIKDHINQAPLLSCQPRPPDSLLYSFNDMAGGSRIAIVIDVIAHAVTHLGHHVEDPENRK
jgi:hypothetical protein